MDESGVYKLPTGHVPFQDYVHEMSVDSESNLYWRSKKLKTEVELSRPVKAFGFWVGIAAIAASVTAVLTFIILIDTTYISEDKVILYLKENSVQITPYVPIGGEQEED